jgi:hypothetical protein
MPDVRSSRSATVSLGLGLGTLAFYLLAGYASPLVGGVGIVLGLWAALAIRRGRGGLRDYPSAAMGVALGLAQFLLLVHLGRGPEGDTTLRIDTVSAS